MSTTASRTDKPAKHPGVDMAPNGSARTCATATEADSALNRAFSAFARVGPALEHADAVDDLLHVVVREVRELVGVERCSIALRDEQAGLFRGCVGQGGDENIDV